MENCNNWFYLCCYIIGAFTLLFMMLLGYNLKWRKQQLELIKRTHELEKKNGAEQRQINELKEEMEKLKKKQGQNPNQP